MTAEKPASVTENELATAIRATLFPVPDRPGWGEGDFNLADLAGTTADKIAGALFTAIGARKAEAARWIAGDLYIDTCVAPGLNPEIYRREQDGWWCYSAGYHSQDGAIDTYGFRRLVPDPGTKPGPVTFAPPHTFVPPYPAEDGPLKQLNLPGHDVRGTAHSHAQGWYHNCPGCKAAASANAEHRDRLRATEGEH